jgi:hypothetical protein
MEFKPKGEENPIADMPPRFPPQHSGAEGAEGIESDPEKAADEKPLPEGKDPKLPKSVTWPKLLEPDSVPKPDKLDEIGPKLLLDEMPPNPELEEEAPKLLKLLEVPKLLELVPGEES